MPRGAGRGQGTVGGRCSPMIAVFAGALHCPKEAQVAKKVVGWRVGGLQ